MTGLPPPPGPSVRAGGDEPSVVELSVDEPSVDEPSVEHDRAALARPQRLAARGAVIYAWEGIRRLGSLGALVALAAFFNDYLWIAGALLVAAAAYGMAAWWRFAFHLSDDDKLVVTAGVFGRRESFVPLDRVSSVDVQQDVVHRLLRVVAVEVDTPGSTSAEVRLPAVTRATGEALRRVCAAHTRTITPEAADREAETEITSHQPRTDQSIAASATNPAATRDEVLVHRSPQELLLIGLSSPLDLAPIGIVGLLFAGGGIIENLIHVSVEDTTERLVGWFGGPQAVLAVIVAFIAVSFMTRLARTVVTFYDFTLWRSPAGLRSAAGLFERRERAAAYERIQIASASHNPIQRRFGFAMLTISMAAAGVLDTKKSIDIPGVTTQEQDAVLDLALNGNPFATPRLHTISSYARRRWILFGTATITALSAVALGAVAWLEPRLDAAPGTLGELSIALAATVAVSASAMTALAHWRWKGWRWGVSNEYIATESRWFSTTTTGCAAFKVQQVSLKQSWGQRRAKVATVQISTAADWVTIPHVSLEEATWLRDLLVYVAETDPRSPL